MKQSSSLEDQFEEALPLAWYAQQRPVFAGGHQVQLLRGGRELFPAMVRALDNARHSVWLANYLTAVEGMPGQVLEALGRAAERGVSVHAVMDGVGSREVPEAVWQGLRDQGVKLAMYRPVKDMRALFNNRNLRRMHLKVCVVDERDAFVGGINLIDDHYDLAQGWSSQPRLDYAVQVQGPCLTPMLHTARAMWTRATLGRDWRDDLIDWIREPGRARRLRRLWQQARLKLTVGEQNLLIAQAGSTQPMRCAFVLRDNLRQRRTIERAALQAIDQAKSRIDIITPYFYPGLRLRRALRDAAERGVRVRLLLQGKVDYRIAGMAARVLYAELQRSGVRIFEYQPAWLHAKVMCVDDEWAMVGSSNLDPLSLLVNLEANLIVRDKGFAHTLGQALHRDFGDSLEVPAHAVGAAGRVARWRRGFVAWVAQVYLRLAGVSRRY